MDFTLEAILHQIRILNNYVRSHSMAAVEIQIIATVSDMNQILQKLNLIATEQVFADIYMEGFVGVKMQIRFLACDLSNATNNTAQFLIDSVIMVRLCRYLSIHFHNGLVLIKMLLGDDQHIYDAAEKCFNMEMHLRHAVLGSIGNVFNQLPTLTVSSSDRMDLVAVTNWFGLVIYEREEQAGQISDVVAQPDAGLATPIRVFHLRQSDRHGWYTFASHHPQDIPGRLVILTGKLLPITGMYWCIPLRQDTVEIAGTVALEGRSREISPGRLVRFFWAICGDSLDINMSKCDPLHRFRVDTRRVLPDENTGYLHKYEKRYESIKQRYAEQTMIDTDYTDTLYTIGKDWNAKFVTEAQLVTKDMRYMMHETVTHVYLAHVAHGGDSSEEIDSNDTDSSQNTAPSLGQGAAENSEFRNTTTTTNPGNLTPATYYVANYEGASSSCPIPQSLNGGKSHSDARRSREPKVPQYLQHYGAIVRNVGTQTDCTGLRTAETQTELVVSLPGTQSVVLARSRTIQTITARVPPRMQPSLQQAQQSVAAPAADSAVPAGRQSQINRIYSQQRRRAPVPVDLAVPSTSDGRSGSNRQRQHALQNILKTPPALVHAMAEDGGEETVFVQPDLSRMRKNGGKFRPKGSQRYAYAAEQCVQDNVRVQAEDGGADGGAAEAHAGDAESGDEASHTVAGGTKRKLKGILKEHPSPKRKSVSFTEEPEIRVFTEHPLEAQIIELDRSTFDPPVIVESVLGFYSMGLSEVHSVGSENVQRVEEVETTIEGEEYDMDMNELEVVDNSQTYYE